MSLNRTACGLVVVLELCFTLFHSEQSLAEAGAGVELKFWSQSFSGTIGDKHVKVDLHALGNHVTGNYCYEPCGRSGLSQIQLEGEQQQSKISLTETVDNKAGKQVTSGQWKLVLHDTSGNGTWSSPDGKKGWSIALTENNSGSHPFPFDIRLLASAEPEYGGDSCAKPPPSISAIRLYKNDRLVQTLPTDSQGTCDMFLPEIVDINFDGYPDLVLAQTLPAGPDVTYDYWIYDPAQGKMVSASAEMGDVTSPDFDPVNKIISVSWRASCCEDGVTTYKWERKHLVQVDTASSYFQPEMINGTLAMCNISPAYQRNGRIEYPDAVYLDGSTLRTTPQKLSDCKGVSSDDVSSFQPMPDSQGPVEVQTWSSQPPAKLIRTDSVLWKKVTVAGGKAMYCPDIPVFNNGKIERRLLKNPDQCSDTPIR
jgi:hypothetical protein